MNLPQKIFGTDGVRGTANVDTPAGNVWCGK